MTSVRTNNVPEVKVKKVLKPTYVIDPSRLNRFNSRNIIFDRILWDSSWKGHMKMYDEVVPDLVKEGKSGYSRVDFALSYASWIVHDAFEGGFSWEKIKLHRNPAGTIGIDWTKTKHPVEDLHKMSTRVKQTARFIGASMVGICKLNRDWIYADIVNYSPREA